MLTRDIRFTTGRSYATLLHIYALMINDPRKASIGIEIEIKTKTEVTN
jgi:hypothetical protein